MVAIKSKYKFRLGKICATPPAIATMERAGQLPLYFLYRHQNCDWGDVCKSDRKLNDEAIANEGNLELQSRVLSSYKTSLGERIWIITEWDRSVTTILLPSDY